MKKLTTEEFIEKARAVHGTERYDYSLVKYVNNHTKVNIRCNRCGNEFPQTPHSHVDQSQGCRPCAIKTVANKQRKSQEDFIKEARALHGDKFDYSRVRYKRADRKVDIICNSCKAVFPQTPTKHVSRGQGCPICGGTKKRTTEEFISNARLIHGNRYNYDLVNYINNKTKVNIICTVCDNIFPQKPNTHLSGAGCSDCAIKVVADKERKPLETFMAEARQTHGDLYNYDKVVYKNANSKVRISCNKCKRVFSQVAADHIRGCGCRHCSSSSSISKLSQHWLTFLGVPDDKHHREVRITFEIEGKKKWMIVDGCVEKTVYEFLGDYWHGNPNNPDYPPDSIHPKIKKTYRELYEMTQKRISDIKASGFEVIVMWESEWEKRQRQLKNL